MSPVIAELFRQAIELPSEERMELVEKLIESLEPAGFDSADVAPAWNAEVQRRISEIDRGDVELVPAEEVFRKLSGQRRGQSEG